MKHSLRALIIALTLAVGLSAPTTSKAQGLVEYALILVLLYGNPGDTIDALYQLDHSGAAGPDQPNCSFDGTVDIDFVEVASGNSAGSTSRNIVLGDLNDFQFEDAIILGPSPETTMAAVMVISGFLPANCVVVANHFKSKSGLTTEIVPPSTLHPGTYTVTEVPPVGSQSDAGEPPIDGVIINLGGGQVANVSVLATPKSLAPGQSAGDCRLDGTLLVSRLDNGQDPIEIPFTTDPVALLPDITSGTTGYFEIKVTNAGPSAVERGKNCDDVRLAVGLANEATGETNASTYVNVHSTSNLSGEIRGP